MVFDAATVLRDAKFVMLAMNAAGDVPPTLLGIIGGFRGTAAGYSRALQTGAGSCPMKLRIAGGSSDNHPSSGPRPRMPASRRRCTSQLPTCRLSHPAAGPPTNLLDQRRKADIVTA
jgi:hypothetical protein